MSHLRPVVSQCILVLLTASGDVSHCSPVVAAARAAPSAGLLADLWFAWTSLRQLPNNLMCNNPRCRVKVRFVPVLLCAEYHATVHIATHFMQGYICDGVHEVSPWWLSKLVPDAPPLPLRSSGMCVNSAFVLFTPECTATILAMSCRKYDNLALFSAASCDDVGFLQEGILSLARAVRAELLRGKNRRPGEFKVRYIERTYAFAFLGV